MKTFKMGFGTDQQAICQVFEMARSTAPCVLVLEDLDSLINDKNRAFFLNEMDGFAVNDGLLTVATTNHPERLDPAILERPSRFDRKYTFHLPKAETRERYLNLRNQELDEAIRMSPEQVVSVAAATEGFSFAYLKELMLSALILWIENPCAKPLAELMASQTETLLMQMSTAPSVGPPMDSEDDDED